VVKAIRPARIYFDAANCKLAGGPPWRAYYKQLRGHLAGIYEKEGEAHGWEIWKLKGSVAAASG
jgi:hypothetical protein